MCVLSAGQVLDLPTFSQVILYLQEMGGCLLALSSNGWLRINEGLIIGTGSHMHCSNAL